MTEPRDRDTKQQKYLRPDNTSGHVGVSWVHRDQRFVVRINRDKRTYCVGSFRTLEEAIEARKIKIEQLDRDKTKVAKKLLPKTAKEIPGFNRYYADADGNIWSCAQSRPKILKRHDSLSGYFLVPISESGGKERNVPIHRLVAFAFHGLAPEDKPICRHLDGNSHNNVPANLKWGTPEENCEDRKKHSRSYGGRLLSPKSVSEIRSLKGVLSMAKLALRFGVGRATISKILNKKTWKDEITHTKIARPEQYKSRAECADELRKLALEIENGNPDELCRSLVDVLIISKSDLSAAVNNDGYERAQYLADNPERSLPTIRTSTFSWKLNQTQVLEICAKKGIKTSGQLGTEYGVTETMIRSIWCGRAWSHVTGLLPPKQRESEKSYAAGI